MAYAAPPPPPPSSYATPPRDPTNVMGRRIVAFIIDLLLIVVAYGVLFAAISKRYTGAPNDACRALRETQTVNSCLQVGSKVYVLQGGRTGAVWGLAILFAFLNNAVLQGATGASIGKFIMGLRVINAEGKVCGFGRAFVRWLLLIVDSFFCYLVGLITASVTHPHRRVGDMVASTYVVAASDVGTPIVPQYPAYAAGGYPPQPATGWGAPPAETPVWGAAAAATTPVWGGPPQEQPPANPVWGGPPQDQPPPGPPSWGTPPPAEQAPPPAWGAPPPAPPASPEAANPWAAPAPPPPAPESWGAPPPPAAPPSWGEPPAPTPPPPAPPQPPAPSPPPVEPPPPPPDTPPPPAAPAGESAGESWWDKATPPDDDEPKQ